MHKDTRKLVPVMRGVDDSKKITEANLETWYLEKALGALLTRALFQLNAKKIRDGQN